jgi:ABC-2 type transport system ATP-binding protein
MITIRDLKKRFGRTEALRGVNLEVPQGRVSAFLGPNGSGKTTTIQCAMHLMGADSGRIEVLGVAPQRLDTGHWRRIGYVAENQRMPEWMTVEGLLDYLRPMYGAQWDRDFERKMMKDFDLPGRTRIGLLSRGQRMKAALLSSLAYRPQLVVLDEPFSGLDPLVREEFLSGLLELTETEGWTVWISSHDMEEVERFADRVAIIDQGRVHLEDEVAAIQARFRMVELVLGGRGCCGTVDCRRIGWTSGRAGAAPGLWIQTTMIIV